MSVSLSVRWMISLDVRLMLDVRRKTKVLKYVYRVKSTIRGLLM